MTSTRSFDPEPSHVATGVGGQRAHRDHLAHLDVLAPRMVTVRDGVWCLVGNGLSNQTFIEGPDGLIAIDTGESVEEMAAALAVLREHTDRPIVAVIYTHSHYVSGTAAIEGDTPLEVIGHELVAVNIGRTGTEAAPVNGRGLVQQFGINPESDGPDGLTHVGVGRFFRNPEHAPFTAGFVPPTRPIAEPTTMTVAGLHVELTPAPSDADDSITIWFPELDTAVNNLVWPALFNVFPIRGEAYRDPLVLVRGIDHLLSLGAEYLVGAHGPPISGRDEIARRVTGVRDAIQYLWDQTLRGINRGWTTDELASRIRLPDAADDDYLTSERYGVAEHHVRQIHNGLRGWFDGDESKLFPLPPADRIARLIDGFGGPEEVRRQAEAAVAAEDLRWALELATWLARRDGATDQDRRLLADTLRAVGYRTPAANIRNWCLTRARDLDGTASLDRFRRSRLRADAVAADPAKALATLPVLLDPDRVAGLNHRVAFDIDGQRVGGLHARNGVAVPTDGSAADSVVRVSAAGLGELLAGRAEWPGAAEVDGDADAVGRAMAAFDLG